MIFLELIFLETNSNKKAKDLLFVGLNKVKDSENVLEALTEFSINTVKYLTADQMDLIVNSLNKDDYIEIIRKYLNKQKRLEKRKG